MIERLSLGPATVSELAEPLEMSLAAVMQHLRLLEESGVVQSEKVGRVRTCRLEATSLSSAEQWIQDRRAMWRENLDRLGDFLAEEYGSEPKPKPHRATPSQRKKRP